jgi:hypothetical protein
MANCNCGGTGDGTRYQLIGGDGKVAGTFLTRTEALAHLTAAGSGYRVVSTTAK